MNDFALMVINKLFDVDTSVIFTVEAFISSPSSSRIREVRVNLDYYIFECSNVSKLTQAFGSVLNLLSLQSAEKQREREIGREGEVRSESSSSPNGDPIAPAKL